MPVEETPQQIGRYKILSELGRGGFGRVYRAYDPTVGRPLAIKVLTEVTADALSRFRNEASVAGNLLHANIVTIYDYGVHEDRPFLAMEYLEGEDLHQIMRSRAPLGILEALGIMLQVASGLECAHKAGVIHRDMKPANIMVVRDGTVKIMDFGIARLSRNADATRLTQQGFLIGTLRYMSPEQLKGADLNAQCDIFAYGAIFYELVTGPYPFEASDAQSLIYKLSFEEPPPITTYVPNAPEGLQKVISKAIHKSRDLRYQNLRELQLDTEAIRADYRGRHAMILLAEARDLVQEERFEEGQRALEEALELEPANRAGRELWEELQQAVRQRVLKPQIESWLNTAEQHLAKRDYASAVAALHSALALDQSNTRIQRRIEQARTLLEDSKEASRLLTEARQEFERRNLTAAYRIASEALQRDPGSPDAADFLTTVQAFAERRQAEQRVEDAIRKAQGLLLIPSYDEAIRVLTDVSGTVASPQSKNS
jgi:serine/threonine-protein kinase